MKHLKRLLVFLLCALLCAAAPVFCCLAAAEADVQRVIDGILAYECRAAGAADTDALIDGALTANAGVTADWYIFGLKQYGFPHDYAGFARALKQYADDNAIPSAVTEERIALLFACLGTEPEYIANVVDSAIGRLGVMSYAYGLHLLNNGYSSRTTTASAVVNTLLEMQREDGGWAVMGTVGDVDVTAMTLAALAPYRSADKTVAKAVEDALAFLSARQLSNGGFKTYGQESPESAAQVIVALTSLGLDPLSAPGFIKNGRTAFDAMLEFRLTDGSFEHAHGKGANHTATVQAFYSSVALFRCLNGQPGLYVLSGDAAAAAPTEQPKESAAAPTKPTGAASPAATEKAAGTTAPAAAKKATVTTVPAATKKAADTTVSTTRKTTDAAQPTTEKRAEPSATTQKALSPAATAISDAAQTTPSESNTAAAQTNDAAEESATAETPATYDAVSAIRPEKRPTLPEFTATENAAAAAEPEGANPSDGRSAFFITGIACAAALTAAVILTVRKKKTADRTPQDGAEG